VPDSGTTPGDWVGINATLANKGPCKVYMGSGTSTIRWTGCVAYSGGRKVVIPAQSSDQAITTGSGVWAHVCIYSSGAVTITQSSTETANAALTGADAWSANTPWLCLADISTTNTAGGKITEIYDTRTFTTSTKELVNNITNASGLGWIMTQTSTAGSVTRSGTTAGTGTIRGVVVSTAYTTTANVPNMIIATAGPAYVKATSAATTVGAIVQNSSTAGYAATGTSTTTYASLGLSLSAFSSTCGASADTCRGSIAVTLSIR
jgi:hypothetical protein